MRGQLRQPRARARVAGLVAVLLGLLLPEAAAQRAASPPATVAIAPLETLGTAARVSRRTHNRVTAAMRSVPGFQLIPARQVVAAARKEPALRACDGEPACLARLGRAVGATYVVFGEVGGLGSAEILYLKLVDVKRGKEAGSTTLELGSRDDDRAARAAATRLLAPDRHVGLLAVTVDVPGATIFVDGQRVARSPSPPVSLAVGTRALRVTHPEFRDFVRFVDVRFEETTEVSASLQEFPIVASDLAANPGAPARPAPGGPVPWHRRWYTAAGLGAVMLVGSAIVVGLLVGGIDADREQVVDIPR